MLSLTFLLQYRNICICLQIRKQAIKDLPSLCKEAPEHLAKVADVLVQLLQTDDNSELSMVQTALLNLFQIQAKGQSSTFYSQNLG